MKEDNLPLLDLSASPQVKNRILSESLKQEDDSWILRRICIP